MAKNVVVCCDGTANEFATDHTNVLKLFRVLDNDPTRQVAFYHPGVGTMEAVGALTSVSRNMSKFLGLAFGYGLERDVCDAYAFLMQQFEPHDALTRSSSARGTSRYSPTSSLSVSCTSQRTATFLFGRRARPRLQTTHASFFLCPSL